MNLDTLIKLYQSADAQIDQENLRLFAEYTGAMRDYAKSIEHVQSGHMQGSTVALGPFPVGQGALESTIISGAWYAGIEASKGGDHDWPTRTIAEQQARILQLELEVAAAAASVLTGGA